mmetsp:Transcript_874/g.2517  ORF Transcript_874/g.2517 Transcript_874/m.2517 type:complete len:194 (+) Transcript_874:74-655(+)
MAPSLRPTTLVALAAAAERAVATWPTQSTPAPASGGIPWLPILGVAQVGLLCGLGIYAWYLCRLWRRSRHVEDSAAEPAAPPPRTRSRSSQRHLAASAESSVASVGNEGHISKLTPTKYRGLMDVSPSPNIARTISSSSVSPKPKDWAQPGTIMACTCTKGSLLREGGVRMALSKIFCGTGDKQVPLQTVLNP